MFLGLATELEVLGGLLMTAAIQTVPDSVYGIKLGYTNEWNACRLLYGDPSRTDE